MTAPGGFDSTHPFDGFSIVKTISMSGCKKAVRQGRTIHVSPAMYDLISNADPKELKFMLANIPMVEIPEIDWNSILN